MGGYLDIQQQLEVMNLRFGEAMNEMNILRTKVKEFIDIPRVEAYEMNYFTFRGVYS
jgi:hypothetical protein